MWIILMSILVVTRTRAGNLDFGPFHLHWETQTSNASKTEKPKEPGSLAFSRGQAAQFPPMLFSSSPVARLHSRVNYPLNINRIFGHVVNTLFDDDEFSDLFSPFSASRGFHPTMVSTRTETKQLPDGSTITTTTKTTNDGWSRSRTSYSTRSSTHPAASMVPPSFLSNVLGMFNPPRDRTRPAAAPKGYSAKPDSNSSQAPVRQTGGNPALAETTSASLHSSPHFPGAQPEAAVHVVSQCVADAQRLCTELVRQGANYLKIFQCLKLSHAELSAPCKSDVYSSPAFHCSNDLHTFCPQVYDRSTARKCLDNHKGELSHDCLQTIVAKATSKVPEIHGQPQVSVGGKIVKVNRRKSAPLDLHGSSKEISHGLLYGLIGGGVVLFVAFFALCTIKCRKSSKPINFTELPNRNEMVSDLPVPTPSLSTVEELLV
mmetsp:Transcript_6920/g.10699  ORF Transcript_6920/g.10699 Transcript_6920/m.10699 type:complete len:432 (+) Transcript_6920:13-1308(+)